MALSENLGVPENNIEKIREFRDTLLERRDLYLNVLPKQRVSSFAYEYKCRTNWWHGIIYLFNYFKQDVSDNKNVLEKMDKVLEHINFVFPKEHYLGAENKNVVKYEIKDIEKFRTKEELDTMNQLLTELIDELDNLLTK